MRLSPYIPIVALSTCALLFACKKHNTAQESTSSLLQHKWKITSLNGEVFRYIGTSPDYFDFENGRLIEYFSGQYDTLAYTIINNGSAVQLQTVSNAPLLNLDIKVLTSSQLILDGSGSMPTIHILDSLYR